MAENKEISENGNKMLFAEEVVNFIRVRINQRLCQPLVDEQYRGLVHHGFNDSVQSALCFLERTMYKHIEDISHLTENENLTKHEHYTKIADGLLIRYFYEGFEVENFLKYCVHVVHLAVFFYNHGVSEAYSLAASRIFNVFQGHDMIYDRLLALIRRAKLYTSMDQDFLYKESQRRIGADEIPQDHGKSKHKCVATYENDGSNDKVTVVKQNNLEANKEISNFLKCSPSEKEPTVSRSTCTFDSEIMNISENPKILPSISEMADSEEFDNSCCRNELGLKDDINSSS